jgi:hypothetical protein
MDGQEQEIQTPEAADVEETPENEFLEWTAVESLHLKPTRVWYLALALVVLALLAVAVIFQLWFSVALFLVMGVAVAVYTRRQIAPISYRVDNTGVTIDKRFYPLSRLKSFGVVEDLGWQTIDFETTQRFMPRLMVMYNDDATRDAVTAFLAARLPRQDRHPDLFEAVARYLHLS